MLHMVYLNGLIADARVRRHMLLHLCAAVASEQDLVVQYFVDAFGLHRHYESLMFFHHPVKAKI